MLSSLLSLLPFLLFAFVASITPGPTNILVLSNSAQFGFKASMPFIVSASASAASVVLLVGCGLGDVLGLVPRLQIAMQWAGTLWLSLLAWKIFRSPPVLVDSETLGTGSVAGVWTAISLQWINPKTWMMALAVISVFNDKGPDRLEQVGWMSLSFFLVAMPCLSVWAALGAGSRQSMSSPRIRNNFNRMLGVLLLLSTWLGLWW
ncbi:LysE family translocator [Pseudomonas sp. B21-053]|uniref:LysE family translocator n=1 Tax=Pseudomonas sp. B21-053 TaxID=2895493 RepID=UPI0022305976|nr:LysE family translocator [Pseudomonas sp. B21-053]UZE15200.1 LysE family translocator [Pseudomonas sp. B21-053]